jgi:hypothetical protein
MQVGRRGGAGVEGRARALSFGNSLFRMANVKLEFFHARRARGVRAEERSRHYRFKHFQCTADNPRSELALELLAACIVEGNVTEQRSPRALKAFDSQAFTARPFVPQG